MRCYDELLLFQASSGGSSETGEKTEKGSGGKSGEKYERKSVRVVLTSSSPDSYWTFFASHLFVNRQLRPVAGRTRRSADLRKVAENVSSDPHARVMT